MFILSPTLSVSLSPSLSLSLSQSDPFLKIFIGKNKINDVDNYIANNLNPLFGKMFELPATLPLDHTLKIQVMDYDRTSANDLIGETEIDLENRFLTQHRAICGLPETFSKSVELSYISFNFILFSFCRRGPNRWRDYQYPKDILSWYCKAQRIPEPVWVSNEEVLFNGVTYNINQFGKIMDFIVL